jgi:hypothetical protein
LHKVLLKHLHERESQIARAVEHASGSSVVRAAIDRLRELEPLGAGSLEVVWRLEKFLGIKTARETAAVVYDRQKRHLLVAGELDGEMWIDIARELEVCLTDECGSLAPYLKEILAAEDGVAADRSLDRYDVPRLATALPAPPTDQAVGLGFDPDEAVEPEEALETESEGADEDVAEDPDSTDLEPEDTLSSDEESSGEADEGDEDAHGLDTDDEEDAATSTSISSNGGGPHKRGKRSHRSNGGSPNGGKRRRQSDSTDGSEWWFVIVSGTADPAEKSQSTNGSNAQASRSRIEQAGVRAVLDAEEEAGRIATEMPVNNEGYDIESTNEAGETLRYIEVKSLGGSWGADGFPKITPPQLRWALEHEEHAWLYVVEHAESDDPRITRISDYANRATRFVYDPGWQALDQSNDTPSDQPVAKGAKVRKSVLGG